MSEESRFKAAFPYQKDVLALPVVDIDAAARWYCGCFRMVEIERRTDPVPVVILERDGTRLGFAVNGADPAQDGAAILVSGIQGIRSQLQASGVAAGELCVHQREGQSFHAFFVVAPDGLCYYFHEPLRP
jgi:hypothetical protein